METIVAQRRIATALLRKIPLATLQVFTAGDEVLIYREKEPIKSQVLYKITIIEKKTGVH